MSEPANILLIGARACGKSTAGRLLAELRGAPFVDLDEAVLASFGARTAAAVWEAHGEQAWRDVEVRLLAELLAVPGRVVALGGGAPTIAAARRTIDAERARGRAVVVYLRCPASTLRARLQGEPGDRPSLTGRPPAEEIADVLRRREPIYLELADLVVDADGRSPRSTAARIQQLLS